MITYRKGIIDDLVQIQELHAELLSYEQSFEALYNLDYDKSKDSDTYFKSRLIDSKGIIFIAEENNKIIGYICGHIGIEEYRMTHSVADVESFFVKSEYRGQQIGDKLIDLFIELTKSKGISRIKLEAVHNNERAINFYTKKGFKPTYTELELSN